MWKKLTYRLSTQHKTEIKIIAWLSNKEEKIELLSRSKKNKCTTNQV